MAAYGLCQLLSLSRVSIAHKKEMVYGFFVHLAVWVTFLAEFRLGFVDPVEV